MSEIELTVDTGILMVAFGISDRKCDTCHQQLKGAIETKVFLALDGESFDRPGPVLVEYQQKFGEGSPGRTWLRYIFSRLRARFHGRPAKLGKRLRQKLEKKSFDPGDYKFVSLAMDTETKYLVTEDDDYSTEVCRILKQEGVEVHVPSTANAIVGANLEADPLV